MNPTSIEFLAALFHANIGKGMDNKPAYDRAVASRDYFVQRLDADERAREEARAALPGGAKQPPKE